MKKGKVVIALVNLPDEIHVHVSGLYQLTENDIIMIIMLLFSNIKFNRIRGNGLHLHHI